MHSPAKSVLSGVLLILKPISRYRLLRSGFLALPDSILLVGGATDIQGKFQLAVTIPKSKSILLHISYIGYTSVYRTISVSANNKTPTLGNISLSPESISLNETVVVGQAPMAVTEGDTTVFNASAYRTPEAPCWKNW